MLLTFLIIAAVEAFDSFDFRDFDWEAVGDIIGCTAACLAPFFAFANLVKFFTIAYHWFFEV